jgi:hypothetical protein
MPPFLLSENQHVRVQRIGEEPAEDVPSTGI